MVRTMDGGRTGGEQAWGPRYSYIFFGGQKSEPWMGAKAVEIRLGSGWSYIFFRGSEPCMGMEAVKNRLGPGLSYIIFWVGGGGVEAVESKLGGLGGVTYFFFFGGGVSTLNGGRSEGEQTWAWVDLYMYLFSSFRNSICTSISNQLGFKHLTQDR